MLKSMELLEAIGKTAMPGNLVPEKFEDTKNWLRYRVAAHEKSVMLQSSISGKKLKDIVDVLENNFPGKNWYELSEDEVKKSYREISADIVKKQDDYKSIATILGKLESAGINHDSYEQLDSTDKIFLTIVAHACNKAIRISLNDVQDDMKGMIKKWYEKGQGSPKIKEECRNQFYRLCGRNGEMFMGVKLRNSDVKDKLIRHFIASFGGNASIDAKRTEGKIESIDGFTYKLRTAKQNIEASFTDFAAVLLLDKAGNYIEIGLPEEKAEEKAEEKKEEIA